jgi:hypothetical protein
MAGALSDDLGYYFTWDDGLNTLTDFTHYVRTGEWVEYLLQSAQHDPLRYAFALGVLSHYSVDRMGHYYGTNVVAAMVAGTDKLYGGRMSYERNQRIHTTVEATFDFLSLGADCSADVLSSRIQTFLSQGDWRDAEAIYGFFVQALDTFHKFPLALTFEKFRHALFLAKKTVIRTLVYGKALYPSMTPGPDKEDAKESSAIDEYITNGMSVAQRCGKDCLKIFAESFSKANGLFAALIHSRTQTLPNINLDTNTLSASGRYELADKNYEKIAAAGKVGGTICPPDAGVAADYFLQGKTDHDLLTRSASSSPAKLVQKLVAVSALLAKEHDITDNDVSAKVDLKTVSITRLPFTNPGVCPDVGTKPFGTSSGICISEGKVVWDGNADLLDLWFATATSRDTGAKAAKGVARYDTLEPQRVETAESFRLRDSNNQRGYFQSSFCAARLRNQK